MADQTDTGERVFVPHEDAVRLVVDGDTVHTFRSTDYALIGADIARAQIIERMAHCQAELSGETATRMRHGLTLLDSVGWLFIETDAGRLAAWTEAHDAAHEFGAP